MLIKNKTSYPLLGACLFALSTLLPAPPAVAQESSITVVSYGGAAKRAKEQWLFPPFTEASGVRVISSEYNGELAKIKSMVDSNSVVWNIVQAEGPDILRYCDEGLFERLDWSTISDTRLLMDDAARECGSAVYTWGIALSWNSERLKTAPTGWADFWDVEKIPGKRGFQRKPIGILEWALLADGVAREHVYHELATEAGQNRAFAKLDSIKKDIVWFDAYSQAPQLLNDGDAIMVQAPHGRFYEAIRNQNSPFVILWDGHVYDYDIWSIPKGTPKLALAKRFVTFATESAPLVGGTDLSYSPTRKSSLALVKMDDVLRNNLPTSHLDIGIQSNSEFWADYGQALDERFAEWLLTN